MTELVVAVGDLLNYEPEQQIVLILLVGFVALAWLAHSRAQKECQDALQHARAAHHEFHSPAYHLLLARRGKLLSEDDFRQRFAQILITKGHWVQIDGKASGDFRQAVRSWLLGDRRYETEALLQVHLEDVNTKVSEALAVADDP